MLQQRVASSAMASSSGATASPQLLLRHLRPTHQRTPCRTLRLVARAATSNGEVYQGRFGPWRIEQQDVVEVWGYRAGLSVAALATLAASSLAFLPDSAPAASAAVTAALDPLCLLGAAGLGVSLQLIHIYIAPMKRALQALWAAGLLGALYIMATQDTPAALYVAQNPWAVWLVGPLFASLTGVAFKEGFCYGKWEAGGLFGVVPLLMLGHLSGLASPDVEHGLLASMDLILFIFAARKYTQAIKDDIGDKSVFEFMKLTPAQQQRLLAGDVHTPEADN